jgi:hypothetical protein
MTFVPEKQISERQQRNPKVTARGWYLQVFQVLWLICLRAVVVQVGENFCNYLTGVNNIMSKCIEYEPLTRLGLSRDLGPEWACGSLYVGKVHGSSEFRGQPITGVF